MRIDKALSGKRIVVTRAAEQSRELVSALEAKGAQVSLFPLVVFTPPEDWRLLDEQLRKLQGFDSILFLSRNAVRYLFQRCRELAIQCESSSSKRPFIATVGRATEEAVRREGWSVDYVAKGHTARSLGSELNAYLAGKNVLVPRGNRGDDRLAGALREAGARVTEVVTYRTVAPETVDPGILASIRASRIDCIVFASPSAFRHLCELLPAAEVAKISQLVQFAAIGPTTAGAIRASGARVAIQAGEPSAASIAAAVARYFESQAVKTRPA
jgi:uroporphyrinogen-III synthase